MYCSSLLTESYYNFINEWAQLHMFWNCLLRLSTKQLESHIRKATNSGLLSSNFTNSLEITHESTCIYIIAFQYGYDMSRYNDLYLVSIPVLGFAIIISFPSSFHLFLSISLYLFMYHNMVILSYDIMFFINNVTIV